MIPKEEIRFEVPEESGVYFLYDSKGELVYVGKSTNLRKRLLERASYNIWMDAKREIKPFFYVRYSLIKDEQELKEQELNYIKEIKPKLNDKTKYYWLEEPKKFSIEEKRERMRKIFD